MRTPAPLIAALVAAHTAAAAPVAKGEVEMPLSEWDAAMETLRPDSSRRMPPVQAAHIERRIEGRFHKGLFRGTLVDRFVVEDTIGYVQVPILDAKASLGAVTVSGRGTSLFKDNDMYMLGVERAGIYEVRLEFFAGEDQDRFARALSFRLPDGGVTALSIYLPETDIEPTLAGGVLTRTETRGDETLVEGWIGADGNVDLSWTRRLTHRTDQAVAMKAALYTVFTFREAVISGVTRFDYTVREGETDAVTVALPDGIEVVKVEGDTVLQWAQESRGGGKLTVLLRHLVSDAIRFFVHFQMPLDTGKPVRLKMPLPAEGTPFTGAAGVQGPLWLNIQTDEVDAAEAIPVRDLPREIFSMTQNPLLFGFKFDAAPTLTMRVTQHRDIALTSTVIEELEASTVQMADGTRVTKMKLRIRNNTRETMSVTLPEEAELTHAFLDGHPIRPTLPLLGDENVLHFPLRQSERLAAGEPRIHVVRPGETLSDIANFYFGHPAKWPDILNANPGHSETGVRVGESLIIPAQKEAATFEESAFVLELAYKQKGVPLGKAGQTFFSLPALDVDSMKVLWHLYFPEALDPLSMTSNLVQYSHIRYDPFRRFRDFLTRAMWERNAFAGGSYRSILKSRKAIYATEFQSRETEQTVRNAFPLVGRLYKFRRVLLQRDVPGISLVYVHRDVGIAFAVLAFFIGFTAAMVLLRRPDIGAWIALGFVLLLTLVLAHYFLGMHRCLLWGVDLALAVKVLRTRGRAAARAVKEVLYAPWLLIPRFTFRNLLFAIGALFVLSLMLLFPLLLSTITFVVLLLGVRKGAAKGVAHE